MATLPSPRTWTSSEQVTAAKLNADIRDSFNFYKQPPLARLRKSASQSVPNSTSTVVTWDTEVIDRDAGHSNVTNNSRYTAQTAGWYHLRATLMWANNGWHPSWQDLFFRKNGSAMQNRSVRVAHETFFDAPHTAEGYMRLLVGDYVEVLTIILGSSGAVDIKPNSGIPIYTTWDIRWVSG